MMSREEAENSLREWATATADRDALVRAAHAAGINKHRIHTITGISRTTIDRILERTMTTTVHALTYHTTRSGKTSIVGTWKAFQAQLGLPDDPTDADREAAVGREITVLDRDGASHTEKISYLAKPKEFGGVLRCYATAIVPPRPTRSGTCDQCGWRAAGLVERVDGSGISGWCCPTCDRLDDLELVFG